MVNNYSNLEVLDLGAMPNLGDLLGTTVSTNLVGHLNTVGDRYGYYGSTYDRFRERRETFVQQLVNPISQAGHLVKETVTMFQEPSNIARLEEIDDLRNVHPEMYMAILTHQPIYDLLKKGRIDGYGVDFEAVKREKETYDRILETNGFIDHGDGQRYGDTMFVSWEIASDDPQFTDEELDILMDNRDFIDEVLKTSSIDPTDPDNIRG